MADEKILTNEKLPFEDVITEESFGKKNVVHFLEEQKIESIEFDNEVQLKSNKNQNIGLELISKEKNNQTQIVEKFKDSTDEKLVIGKKLNDDTTPIRDNFKDSTDEKLVIKEKSNKETILFRNQDLGEEKVVVREKTAENIQRIENITIAYEPVWAIGTGISASTMDCKNGIETIR